MIHILLFALVSLLVAAALALAWLVGRDDRRQTQFAQSVIDARHIAVERGNRVHR
jgi:hypothetical protein